MQYLELTIAQMQQYFGVTSNLNSAKALDPFAKMASEFDVRAFLGDELYIALLDDIAASPSLDTYSDLYNGSTYTYQNKRYRHEGIIAMLAHFTNARYIEQANVTSTKYGLKQKENDWSTTPSEKTISRMINQARSIAIAYQERVKRYLDHHSTETKFEMWPGGHHRRRTHVRITAIGGNSRKHIPNNDCCDTTVVVNQSTNGGCGDDYVNSDYVE